MLAALLAFAQVYTDGRPVPGFPTGGSLYAACKSYDRHLVNPNAPNDQSGDTDPAYCGVLGIQVITQFSGEDKGGPHYCLPNKTDVSKIMTETFIHYYERSPSKWSKLDGRPVFVQAMLDTWPCESTVKKLEIGDDMVRQDVRLNAAYRELMREWESNPSRRLALRDSERAWLAERDKKCGAAPTAAKHGCLRDMTKARADALESEAHL